MKKKLSLLNKLNRRQRYAVVAVLALVLALVLLAASRPISSPPIDGGQAQRPQAAVSITADGFVPATLAIMPGTTVVWTNDDSQPHRVASNPHPEHSDLSGLYGPADIPPGGSYEFTFESAGTYGYHDERQLTSNGTVEVQ